LTPIVKVAATLFMVYIFLVLAMPGVESGEPENFVFAIMRSPLLLTHKLIYAAFGGK